MAVHVIGAIIYAYNITYAYIYAYIINIYAYIGAIYAYIVVIYTYSVTSIRAQLKSHLQGIQRN